MLPVNHENFQIWQECRLLLLLIYKSTAFFPKKDAICLKNKLQDDCVGILAHLVRSMRSAPAQINLVELNNSVQSLQELEKCLNKAYQNHLLKFVEFNQLKNKANKLQIHLSHFIGDRSQKAINN
ncbi:four helix bundle protein [candidate division KSB1 bacterium]|nr:four helix bundle protein [candidate division KSB1 bacterium]